MTSRAPAVPSAAGRAGADASLVLAAAALTVTLWAGAFMVIRAVGPHYDPGSLSLLRVLVGSACLGALAAHRGVQWPPRRTWGLLAVWGVAWFAVYNLALNQAERMIDAGTAAMIVNVAPLLVVLLAGLLLGEGYPRGLVVGAPLSFLGVVLIGAQGSGGHAGLGGVALALVASLCYAGCTLLQKHLLRTVDSTTLTWLGTAAGAAALLPWASRMLHDVTTAPAWATWAVVGLGVFPTAVAFTTWAYVLQRSSAGQTAATTYVVPALTIALSWLFLGEVPTPLTLLGGGLCLLGVFLTRALRGR